MDHVLGKDLISEPLASFSRQHRAFRPVRLVRASAFGPCAPFLDRRARTRHLLGIQWAVGSELKALAGRIDQGVQSVSRVSARHLGGGQYSNVRPTTTDDNRALPPSNAPQNLLGCTAEVQKRRRMQTNVYGQMQSKIEAKSKKKLGASEARRDPCATKHTVMYACHRTGLLSSLHERVQEPVR